VTHRYIAIKSFNNSYYLYYNATAVYYSDIYTCTYIVEQRYVSVCRIISNAESRNYFNYQSNKMQTKISMLF